MKDVYEAFEEHLHDMIVLLSSMKLEGCFQTAADLTRLCTLLDFKRGVFIAETLESVFVQVNAAFQRHAVPEEKKTSVVHAMEGNLGKLMSNYRGDKEKLYDILEDLRFAATEFQIKHAPKLPMRGRSTSAGSDTG